jgi:hypothetical protein
MLEELQELYNVCVVIRDNAKKNKSCEVIELFESKGIKSYFSTLYEQRQNDQRGIVDKFIDDTSTISHGRVWPSWAILVQYCNGCERCAQCDVQGAYQNDSIHAIIRKEEGYS